MIKGFIMVDVKIGDGRFDVEEFDDVNKPVHYNYTGVECIDAIQAATGVDGFETYLQGNIMKYLWRYKYKNGKLDLLKAYRKSGRLFL